MSRFEARSHGRRDRCAVASSASSPTSHLSALALAAVAAVPGLAASAAEAGGPPGGEPLPAVSLLLAGSLFEGGSVADPLDGVAFLVQRDGDVVYRRAFGDQSLDDVFPVASATKWLSGAVIVAALDRGEMTLGEPIGTWLPTWTVPDKAGITIRQAFSHTAGLPAQSATQFSDLLTLQQAADSMAGLPLNFVPGEMFGYGGVSMHAAGAATEVASGLAWREQFGQRIAEPLGLEQTAWTQAGAPANPMIGGGASSTIDDYAAFLRMIEAEGRTDAGEFVLSPLAVRIMLGGQSGEPPIFSSPLPGVSDYGVGVWREEADDVSGRPILVSSPGALGTTPWIDFERGYSAILFVDDSYANVAPLVAALREALDAAFDPVCPSDRNGDRRTDFRDLLEVLAGWGPGDEPWTGGDANGDAVTNFEDLLAVLSAWGPCGP